MQLICAKYAFCPSDLTEEETRLWLTHLNLSPNSKIFHSQYPGVDLEYCDNFISAASIRVWYWQWQDQILIDMDTMTVGLVALNGHIIINNRFGDCHLIDSSFDADVFMQFKRYRMCLSICYYNTIDASSQFADFNLQEQTSIQIAREADRINQR